MWISRILYPELSSTNLQISICISHTAAVFFYYMVSFHANITIPTVIWTRKWQLKYRKSSKHKKATYNPKIPDQVRQIERGCFPVTERAAHELLLMTTQLDFTRFSPLERQIIWFTSQELGFICSRTSSLKCCFQQWWKKESFT